MVSKTASISRSDDFQGWKVFQTAPPRLNATGGKPATACAFKLAIDLRIFRAKHRKCFFPFDVPSAV